MQRTRIWTIRSDNRGGWRPGVDVDGVMGVGCSQRRPERQPGPGQGLGVRPAANWKLFSRENPLLCPIIARSFFVRCLLGVCVCVCARLHLLWDNCFCQSCAVHECSYLPKQPLAENAGHLGKVQTTENVSPANHTLPRSKCSWGGGGQKNVEHFQLFNEERLRVGVKSV